MDNTHSQIKGLMEIDSSLHKFSQAFSQIIWVTDANAQVEFINEYGLNYFGFKDTNLSPEEFAKTVHPDEIEQITEVWKKSLELKIPIENIQRQRNKHGDYEWFKVSANPIFDDEGNIIKWIGISININDEVNLNKQLEISNDRLELVMKSTKTGMWDWNLESNEILYNDNWSEMLGYDPGEIKNDPGTWEKLLHPDDRKNAIDVLEDHISGKSDYYESVFRLKTKSGSWKWIYDSGRAIERDSSGKAVRFIGMQQDYSTRKESEKILEESERKLKILAESAQRLLEIDTEEEVYDHIVDQVYESIDQKGMIVFTAYEENMTRWRTLRHRGINPLVERVTKLIGRPIDNLTGKTHDHVISEMITGKLSYYKPPISKETHGSLSSIVTKQLKKFMNLDKIYGIGITKDKVLYGSISIILNDNSFVIDAPLIETIVYQGASTLQRIEAQKSLLEKNKKLTTLNNEFDLVIQGLSHDLKSPIHSIKGILELKNLEPESISEEYLLNQMTKAINRLDIITNDLLGIVFNNRTDLDIESVKLSDIINDCITEQEESGSTPDINWIRSYNQKGTFNTDVKRIKMILRNLLNNAVKYQDPNKEVKEVNVQFKTDSQFAVISIRDNGIGMKTEQLDKIFDIFYRVGYDNKGIGLGLHIIKQTVERLNGKIDVKSNFGEGSEFTLTLPNYSK